MASRNSIKIYIEGAYYHIYNRGVEKRPIFIDNQDYSVFLRYLREYLEPKNEGALHVKLSLESISRDEKRKVLNLLRLNNFHNEIDLIAYCLMPNHFHLLVKQNQSNSIDKFTNSLLTRYATCFNRKYGRVGRLFQDVYKAVLIETEEQLLHLTRYIHRNPRELEAGARNRQNQYTSLPEYLGKRKTRWVKPQAILNYFSQKHPRNSYLAFVEETDDPNLLKDLTLEIQ